MANRQDICVLDFLLGTLSTSYKGLVTSLIIKDFCITREEQEAVFHGTIMNMPQGEYDMCLMHGGIEVDRTRLSEGRFELRAPASLMDEAASLQMDLVQRGRHIGTFLLKRSGGGGFFGPALEISRDIEGVNFRALCEPLKEKTGLLGQAEALMDAVVSSKKDWPKLSKLIATFAKDLFWYERESFYAWYLVLVRFAAGAAARPGALPEDKLVANVLYLLELPLEKEEDDARLATAVDTWASEATAASARDRAWLAKRYAHAVRVLGQAASRLPGADLRGVLRALVDSLGSMDLPLPEEPVIEALAGAVSPERARALLMFRPRELGRMKDNATRAEGMLADGAPAGQVISVLGGLDAGLADDQRMVGELFGAVEDSLPALGDNAAPVLEGVFALLPRVSEGARQRALSFMPRLVQRCLEMAGPEFCARLLGFLARGGEDGGDVLLEADVARAVWQSRSEALHKSYRRHLLRMALPPPAVAGFSEETWAEISDPRHLRRLRGFLRVAALDPAGPRDVLIHVISCLSVAGVFIPDDTLFQRDVSAFLNSGALRREFRLGSMLLRRLPAFHGDVGATGRVRDLTTKIDSWGNDPLVYFLRKQVHVNASNLNIQLAESVIRAWASGDAEPLRDVVPRQVFENLDRELLSRYASLMGPVLRALGVLDEEGLHFRRLARIAEEVLDRELRRHGEEGEVLQKAGLIFRIYRELVAKYAFEYAEAVTHADLPARLESHMARLRELRQTFLSREPTRPEESLYFKRHIAFGIPSVMGTYHEPKFDAFGEALRVEEKVRVLLETLIGAAEEKMEAFSDDDLRLWTRSLVSLCRLFSLQDLHNPRAEEAVVVLSRSPLRLSQAVDLLRVWQDELTWFVETLYRTFHGSLMRTLDLYRRDQLPAHLRRLEGDQGEFAAKAADLILRDMLSSLPGFAELDRLLNALVKALSYRAGSGRDDVFPPSAEAVPDRSEPAFFVLDELTVDEAVPLAPLLGGKALNLVSVKAAGLPVPPAVIFSASLTRDYEAVTDAETFREHLREAVSILEAKTGERLGDSERPLLLAVRSGSYISMPGVLSSVLYCGMNEPAVEALVRETGDPWFAWDCYGRFITHYADVVLGADPAPLDALRERLLLRHRAADPRELDASRMEELARGYLSALAEGGHAVPGDPYEQLREAVAAIYRSWHALRAESFRRAMGTSAHWGTAVTVMQMVYGNRRGSGSSVFFTRDPATLEPRVYGETREAATGDDLVSGKYFNRPLARTQKGSGLQSLEDTDPDLFQAHATLARRVEEAMGGLPQEVETAYLDGGRKIFVLQAKRMGFRTGATERFSEVCEMDSNIIGRGVGVHGGALSGIAVFPDARDRLEQIRKREGQPLIVLTRETSTDDVSLMPLVDGIVTAVGGAASHAAVLSQKFDLTAVVGCPDLSIRFTENGEMYARIGGHTVQEGTRISIDGSNGLVYSGTCIFRVQERYL